MAEEVRARDDPDADLVQAAQQGDQRAFDQIFLRYQSRVHTIAFRFLNDRAEAEDITQEVFLKVYNSLYNPLTRFRGKSLFATWLYTIVRNSCRNQQKHLAWRKRLVWWTTKEPASQEDALLNVPDPAPGPTEQVEGQRLYYRLQQAIADLTPAHKEILLLWEVAGLSYKQIAEVVGIPIKTVKTRLHRARKELQNALKPFLNHVL